MLARVTLGSTGIETSVAGIGTSAAYEGALFPAKLRVADYPDLLEMAFHHGLTLWDTSLEYGTHPAVCEALRRVPRTKVVICSKGTDLGKAATHAAVERTLRELDTDYLDLFLLQAVRTRWDFMLRRGALEALEELKKKGRIRAIGIATHGLSALRATFNLPQIDVVLGRINYSGHLMDSAEEGLGPILAGIPSFKKALRSCLPTTLFNRLAGSVQAPCTSAENRAEALDLFARLEKAGKTILAMKVLGEGHLAADPRRAITYVRTLPFVSAMVLGCCSKNEILQVVEIFSDEKTT